MTRGAKTSPEMLKARQMIEKGATAYAAAKECGLTTGAITRSVWYLEHRAAQINVPDSASPMSRARALVEGGATAYIAAKLTGLSQSTISRSKWYKNFKGEGLT